MHLIVYVEISVILLAFVLKLSVFFVCIFRGRRQLNLDLIENVQLCWVSLGDISAIDAPLFCS